MRRRIKMRPGKRHKTILINSTGGKISCGMEGGWQTVATKCFSKKGIIYKKKLSRVKQTEFHFSSGYQILRQKFRRISTSHKIEFEKLTISMAYSLCNFQRWNLRGYGEWRGDEKSSSDQKCETNRRGKLHLQTLHIQIRFCKTLCFRW